MSMLHIATDHGEASGQDVGGLFVGGRCGFELDDVLAQEAAGVDNLPPETGAANTSRNNSAEGHLGAGTLRWVSEATLEEPASGEVARRWEEPTLSV